MPRPVRQLALRLGLMAPRQDSWVVRGPDNLTHQNPCLLPANPRGEPSKRRKLTTDCLANSSQRFCIMDAPEIRHAPGFGVANEFFAAIQASDIGFSAMDRSGSR